MGREEKLVVCAIPKPSSGFSWTVIGAVEIYSTTDKSKSNVGIVHAEQHRVDRGVAEWPCTMGIHDDPNSAIWGGLMDG
jgi:hypothetical protein